MYVPAHFRIDDRAALLQVIEAFPLGLVITQDKDQLFADLVPMMLAAEGTKLLAHVARANPLWMRLRAKPEAFIVFQGTDHYISPGYYPGKKENGKAVPTWNYVTVQVRGPVHIHEDGPWLHEHVSQLSNRHERDQAQPWAVDDAPDDYIESQLRAIVGLEIAIASLEGKFKVSQNKNAADRDGVVKGLAALGAEAPDHRASLMAELVRAQGKSG